MPRPSRKNRHTPSPQARANRHTPTSQSPRRSAGKEEALYDLLNDLKEQGKKPFFLILDCIQDPHNLGAILRTADGAGVHAVISPKDKAVGLTETVRRISVGASENIPFFQVTNLARCMEKLSNAGIWLMGTSDAATQSLYQTDLTPPLALVMGAEEKGLRQLTAKHCDALLFIPMEGIIPCLNVSVATGVCLFEALRQRKAASY